MRKTALFSLLIAMFAIAFVACEPKEEDKEATITYFGITDPVNAFGILDDATGTVTINVPYGTDLSNVIGEITLSEVGATIAPDITAGVDLSSLSATFTVSNGAATKTYTVNVIVGANPLKVVLVGDGAYDALDPEIKTAYDWALDHYGNEAKYFSFADLSAEEIETSDVVWFHYTVFPRPDIEGGADPYPASAKSGATILKDFYKAGGNFLITGQAGRYLVELGRITEQFQPWFNGPGDAYIENPDNWGISFQTGHFNADDFPENNRNHPIFKDLNLSDVTFEGVTYPACFLSDGGFKKDRSSGWDFNWYGDLPEFAADTEINDRKNRFEVITGSKVRGSFEWDPAANGVELGVIVEFEPQGDYTGTSVVIGVGAYEWNLLDGRTGAWSSNVSDITMNSIDYLRTK